MLNINVGQAENISKMTSTNLKAKKDEVVTYDRSRISPGVREQAPFPIIGNPTCGYVFQLLMDSSSAELPCRDPSWIHVATHLAYFVAALLKGQNSVTDKSQHEIVRSWDTGIKHGLHGRTYFLGLRGSNPSYVGRWAALPSKSAA